MAQENLEQGFNDSELADIMQEIEGLEKMAQEDEVVDEELLAVTMEDDLNKGPVNISAMSNNEDVKSEKIESKSVEEVNEEEFFKEFEKDMSPTPTPTPISTPIPIKKEIKKEKIQLKEEKIEKMVKEDNLAPVNLNFQVQGTMSLDLGFTLKGKTVRINVGEETGLELFLPDGMKFSIPF